MSEQNFNVLIQDILNRGDIKCYTEEGSLVSLSPGIGHDVENDDYADYLKTVEQDFREDADDILKRLDLSHLRAMTTKKYPTVT